MHATLTSLYFAAFLFFRCTSFSYVHMHILRGFSCFSLNRPFSSIGSNREYWMSVWREGSMILYRRKKQLRQSHVRHDNTYNVIFYYINSVLRISPLTQTEIHVVGFISTSKRTISGVCFAKPRAVIFFFVHWMLSVSAVSSPSQRKTHVRLSNKTTVIYDKNKMRR